MAIEVFNRFENKYILDIETYRKLQEKLSDYMELDEYNKQHYTYTITNLYYDTIDNHLIRTSLSKPKYKEKLRLRAYGIPDSDSMVFTEIKKKVSSLVNKRRSIMTLGEAYEFLNTGRILAMQPYMNPQVIKEISYILECNKLSPVLYLAYDRRAYFETDQHDLRISFDRNIRTRRYDLKLEDGDHGEPLLDKNVWLMEIKTSESIPVWLCRMLSEYGIYPVSFSKYGTEYKQTLENYGPQRVLAFSGKQADNIFTPAAKAYSAG